MTSRRGGSDGYKSPVSPPSSGSEDNGFTNRPRVAGLYVKNLSREELDELAKEGIYGPTGDPNDRPRDGGSQRSLPGSSREPDGRAARAVTSRTPQPPRRSGVGVGHRERTGGLSAENLARRDHHGSLPADRGWPRPERTGARPGAGVASSRASSIDVRISGEDLRQPRRFVEVPRRPDEPSSRVPASMSDRDEAMPGPIGQPPPLYAPLSPPEYSEREEPRKTQRPNVTARTHRVDETEEGSPRSTSENPRASPESTEPRDDSERAPEHRSPPMDKPTSPESKKSESPPTTTTRRIGSRRVQDSTRLRPPLAGIAGTSADSGTGDSGSAEIQADVVTPQAASGDVSDMPRSNGGKTPDARTPGSKGGKQTVKPFTKESLDRLENKTVQLVRDYGFQPKRKMSVEDGAVLPNKFEPFPANLYGRPLEEIDNFIYDEVSSSRRSRSSLVLLCPRSPFFIRHLYN